jgi:hypothetical protein
MTDSYPPRFPTGHAKPDNPDRARWALSLAWAKRELPDEHGPFAASAFETLSRAGLDPDAEMVLKRLQAQGRDRAARDRRTA